MFDWLKIRGQSGGTRDPSDDWWFTGARGADQVTPAAAEGLSALSACVGVISESVGQLPLGIFTRLPNGDKQEQPDHPLFDLLHNQANQEHTAMEFREQLAAFAAMRGTGMAEIVPGRRGPVDQLIPLHPDHIKCVAVEDASGRRQWQVEVKAKGEPMRRLLRDELFIVRGGKPNPGCPLLGLDPLTSHELSIEGALAAQSYGKRFLENDARPGGVVMHPHGFKDEDSRNIWIKAWERAFGRGNRGKTAVLEHGMTYTPISVTPEQAQFLETRKYTDTDIARIFRVPPHKIGILDRATFSNIEHQSLEFLQETMQPWLIRWEQAIRRDLLTSPRFFAEHNVDGLLRSDIKTRYEAYGIARQWGFKNVNEIRRKENDPNLGEDGERYLEPANMRVVGEDSMILDEGGR